MTRIAIAGFGLIGGSIAQAARQKAISTHISAIDRAEVIAEELVREFADVRIDFADDSAVTRAFVDADIVVLSAPVGAIVETVERALQHALVVTDCGSTKRAVVRQAGRSPRAGRFVPGHPLAGSPEGGIAQARADLFEKRRWILCPERADPDAFATVEAFVRSLGAEPVSLSAAEHDRALALTSHVPQLLASALQLLAERRHARHAAGPGFASATRVAGGDPVMWRDVLESNADEIAAALSDLVGELLPVATTLGETPPNVEAAVELIAAARRLRA